jgi:fatty acid desaturase
LSTPYPLNIDVSALERDLNDLRDELRADAGPEDLKHLEKMSLWGRLATFMGFATAWIAPNPISAVLIALGIFGRWTMIAHHVIHRGYDKVPAVPERFRSKVFARKWRRWVDWADWIDPEAWRHEHNTLHHYKLGEVHDPDQPEENFGWLRDSRLPLPLRWIAIAIGMMIWRWAYYAPNTMRMLHIHEQRREGQADADLDFFDWRLWMPFTSPGYKVWFRCWLPYILFHFVLVPLPFLLIGWWAWMSVVVNRLIAEVLANLHTFLIIVPNHAGDDLYRFDEPIAGRGDFYLHQILGSANYRTGGDVNDFLHGFLNYQIEHHLWPDMTMRQYQRAQPRVKEICARHGVPYVQESVFKRFMKLEGIAVGRDTMPVWQETKVAVEASAGE